MQPAALHHGKVTSVGPSLGSFSLSGEMLTTLLEEFQEEIAGKEAKMDSDPHFWMPLTLSKEAYCSVMVTKVGGGVGCVQAEFQFTHELEHAWSQHLRLKWRYVCLTCQAYI
jgi:hypothetical protein